MMNNMNQMNPILMLKNEAGMNLNRAYNDCINMFKNRDTMSNKYGEALFATYYFKAIDIGIDLVNANIPLTMENLLGKVNSSLPYNLIGEANRLNIPPNAIGEALNKLASMGLPIGMNQPMVNNYMGNMPNASFGSGMGSSLTYTTNVNTGNNFTGGYSGRPVDSTYDRPSSPTTNAPVVRDSYSTPTTPMQEPKVTNNSYIPATKPKQALSKYILSPGLSIEYNGTDVEVVGSEKHKIVMGLKEHDKSYTLDKFIELLLYKSQAEDEFSLNDIHVVDINRKVLSYGNGKEDNVSYFIRYVSGSYNVLLSPILGKTVNDLSKDESDLKEAIEEIVHVVRHREFLYKELKNATDHMNTLKENTVTVLKGKVPNCYKEITKIEDKVVILYNDVIVEALSKCPLLHTKVLTLNKYSFDLLYRRLYEISTTTMKDKPVFRLYVVTDSGYIELLVYNTKYAEPNKEAEFKLCAIDSTVNMSR